MDRNFKSILKHTLGSEGGWSDNPKDPGGATMKGVTLKTFRRFVKADATKDDLRKITDAQLETVYRREFWDTVSGAQLPSGVDMAVFDFSVNSGPSRAAKYLQKVVGVKQDGKIGPATLEAVNNMSPTALINTYMDERLAYMKRAKGSSGALKGKLLWPTFKNGWQRRIDSVRSFSLKLAAAPTPEKPLIVETKVEVEKPVVPPTVEKEVRQKTNWLSSTLGGLFGAGGLSAFFAGMDWQSLALVAGIGVVVVIVVLVGGEWLVKRVRSIRRELEA